MTEKTGWPPAELAQDDCRALSLWFAGKPGARYQIQPARNLPCTRWFRYDRMHGWEFNHLEDGHALSDKPTPRFPSQVGWKNATWSKYHAWLTPTHPSRVVHYGSPT